VGHASGPEHEGPADSETSPHRLLRQAPGRNGDFGSNETGHPSRPPATSVGPCRLGRSIRSKGRRCARWSFCPNGTTPGSQTCADVSGRSWSALHGVVGVLIVTCRHGVGRLGGKRQCSCAFLRDTRGAAAILMSTLNQTSSASTGRRSRSLTPSASTPSPWRSSKGRIAGGSHP
jgi:hypothetical protein